MPSLSLERYGAATRPVEDCCRGRAERSRMRRRNAKDDGFRAQQYGPVLSSKTWSDFWGRDIINQGWVLLPPGYKEDTKEKYPDGVFHSWIRRNIDSLTRYVADDQRRDGAPTDAADDLDIARRSQSRRARMSLPTR